MKLKKQVKTKIIAVIVVLLLILLGFLIWKSLNSSKKEVKEVKVVSKIDKYGYKLKDNKPAAYKKLFKELETILNEKTPDEKKYASKISEMFIYDFYSLEDKTAKTDIGGVDFVYNEVLDNFLKNAQNTYYKYVENNIYGNRNQKLPVVDKIEIGDIIQGPFAYGDKNDEKAYVIPVSWTYTSEEFNTYQKSATLVFIHDGNRLSLVELQ